MDEKIPKTVPFIAVFVDICHGRCKARLQAFTVVLKQPECEAPHDSSKPGKNICLRRRDDALGYQKLGDTIDDTRQQVQVDLDKRKGRGGGRGDILEVEGMW